MKKTVLLLMLPLLCALHLFGQYSGDTTLLETFEHRITEISMNPATSQNLWQIGSPQKTVFSQSLSLPNALITDTLQPYGYGPTSSVTVKFRIPLRQNRSVPQLNIRFWHKYDTDAGKDGGNVELSLDDSLFYNVFDFDSINTYGPLQTQNFYSAADSVESLGCPGFSGTSTDWTEAGLCFTWFPHYYGLMQDSLNLSLRFNFASDAIESSGDGWMIDDISAHYYDGVGLYELKDGRALEIYPNPTSGIVQLESAASPGRFTFEITNMQGNILKSGTLLHLSHSTLDISELKSGPYILHIYNEDRHYRNIVVKM